ncbi:TLC domain-containing protein [Xylaria arbuscula]|nr:TLC domain-containing protein [Xylaria arbuscula]
METNNIVDYPVDQLHSAMEGRKLRSRRLRKARKQIELEKEALRWKIPFSLITIILWFYLVSPVGFELLRPLIYLSYKVKVNVTTDGAVVAEEYGKGPLDIPFVAFYALVLFFAREYISQEIFRPLAIRLGITSRSKVHKFNEQAWVVLFTGIAGPLGVYVMYHSPTWYFSTAGMYAAYPHKTHLAVTKFYYLFLAAFWAQQALVMILGLETRRRDFRELVIHHVVTLSLIGLSYRFHFTMMGVLIYVTHDVSDFFLAASKTFNYIDSPWQGPYYVLCVVVWVYTRHYINLHILYSILTEFRTIGPYVLDWEQEQYKCVISNVITFVLLAMLQVLNIYWSKCLLRVGYQFAFLGIAKDDREEEDDHSEPEDNKPDDKELDDNESDSKEE